MRYDYECKCGYVEEIEHGMKETPKVKCKKCGGKMVKQICGYKHVSMNNHWGTSLEEANS